MFNPTSHSLAPGPFPVPRDRDGDCRPGWAARCRAEALEPRQMFAAAAAAAAGGLDGSFGRGGQATVRLGSGEWELVVAGLDAGVDGRVVVAVATPGEADTNNRPRDPSLVRLTAAGKRDRKFRADAAVAGLARFGGLAVQPDGKVLVTGSTDAGLPVVRRLNADGSPDASFGDPASGVVGQVGLPLFDLDPVRYGPSAPRVMTDGRIVIGGGAVGADGRVAPDGDPVAGSEPGSPFGRFAAVRLTPAGAFDPTFGGGDGTTVLDAPNDYYGEEGVDGYVTNVALQSDGKIVLGGAFEDDDTDNGARIVRVNADGTYDDTFGGHNSASGDTDELIGLEVGPDDRIYYAIDYRASDSFVQPYRLSPDGRRDDRPYEHFQSNGDLFGGNSSAGLSVGPDGRLLLYGDYGFFDPQSEVGVPSDLPSRRPDDPQGPLYGAFRWDADGTYDRTFGTGGVARQITPEAGTVQAAAGRVLMATAGSGKLYVQALKYGPAAPVERPTVVLQRGGILAVEGTAGPDAIEVVRAGRKIRVSADGTSKAFRALAVKMVLVDGGDGDDALRVETGDVPSRVTAGDGNDAVTGDGAIFGGRGDDRVVVVGPATVVGGYGSDTVDNSFGTGSLFGLVAYEPAFFNGDNEDDPDAVDTLTYERRSEPVDIVTAAGPDAFSLYGNGFEVLVGGMGDDTLKVTKATPDPSGIYGPVRFVGGPGNDLLVGGAAADVLDGGPGEDRLYGMYGDDVLLGADGFVDYLDGGDGADRAVKDAGDATFGVETIG